MKGVITRRDLLRRPFLVIRHFGIVVFMKALIFKNRSFLTLIHKPQEVIPDSVKPYTSTMDVFSYYERRVGELFLCLADNFKDIKEAGRLYHELAKQKMGQYALLQFVRSFAGKRKIRNEKWQPHLGKIEHLETQIESCGEKIRGGQLSLDEAIWVTENLAFSDLNSAFSDLKDSIYSNRATAFSHLLLSDRHYEDLCKKGLEKLRKIAAASQRYTTSDKRQATRNIKS